MLPCEYSDRDCHLSSTHQLESESAAIREDAYVDAGVDAVVGARPLGEDMVGSKHALCEFIAPAIEEKSRKLRPSSTMDTGAEVDDTAVYAAAPSNGPKSGRGRLPMRPAPPCQQVRT